MTPTLPLRPRRRVHWGHVTRLTVCLGLNDPCVAAGGLCWLPAQTRERTHLEVLLQGQRSMLLNLSDTVCVKTPTQGVMRERSSSQEQRQAALVTPTSDESRRKLKVKKGEVTEVKSSLRFLWLIDAFYLFVCSTINKNVQVFKKCLFLTNISKNNPFEGCGESS